MSEVEVIRVIRTALTRKGKGTEEDPIRRITEYWDLKGNLLWSEDPFEEFRKQEQKIDFKV